MFRIEKNDHVHVTEDCQFGRAGADLGLFADVIVNHIAAIDPDNPADSLVYRVARAVCDAHQAHCAELKATHAAELERMRNPQPDDAEAIEAAAQRRAIEIRRDKLIESRAQELAAE